MECEVRVDLLKLLGQTYTNKVIRVTLEEKAFLLLCNGKVEKFPYRKIKQLDENGRLLFQSDGLKLLFAKSANDFEQRLSAAVHSGSCVTAVAKEPIKKRVEKSVPAAVNPSAPSRIAKEPLFKSSAPSTTLSGLTTQRSIKAVMANPDSQKQAVSQQVSTKTSPDFAKTNVNIKQDMASTAKPGSANKKDASPGGITLTLGRREHAEFDLYGDAESSPLSPDRPTASPDTLFPTTEASHVASPIPKVLRKYGSVNTNARVLHDDTPLNSLFSLCTAPNAGMSAPKKSAGTPAAATVPAIASAVSIKSIREASSTPSSNVKLETKHTRLMSALEVLSATNNATSSSSGSASGSNSASKLWLSSNLHSSGGSSSVMKRLVPATPTPCPYSYPYQHASVSGKLAEEAIDLTAPAEKPPAAAPAPNTFSTSSWFRKFLTTKPQQAEEALRLPLRPRLPGGVRNLGNTCYIGATVQALCAQQLVKDRLGAPFWPSLVALQNASLSQLPPPPARPAAAKAGSSASTAMHVIDSDSGSLGGDTTEAEASLDPNAETSPPTATVDDETVDCAMVGASSEDTTVAGNVDLFAFEGAGGPSSPTTAPAEAVEGEEKPLADPLEKYRVHSVLLELTALVRQKVQWEAEAATTTTRVPLTSTGSSGLNFGPLQSAAKVLDVTRLKRAVSHHTRRYIGYSQQDAHEFLTDLLLLIEEETAARWEALCAAWQHLHQLHQLQLEPEEQVTAGSAAKTGVFETPGKPQQQDNAVLGSSGSKRPASDGTAPSNMTVKKQRVSAGSDSNTDAAGQGPLLLLPVAEIFQSSVCVNMRCLSCGYKYAAKHEPYQHLSLDLNSTSSSGGSAALQVDSLLRIFFAEETRELNCEHCAVTASGAYSEHAQSPDTVACPLSADKGRGRAAASTALAVAPRVLVLQLKRFRYEPSKQDMVKVHTQVRFPATLDVGAYMSVPASATVAPAEGREGGGGLWAQCAQEVLRGPCHPTQLLQLLEGERGTGVAEALRRSGKYALTAVVRHLGGTERSGHYICDVQTATKEATSVGIEGTRDNILTDTASNADNWRRCDDSSVYAIEQDAVLSQREDPYLLFYTAV